MSCPRRLHDALKTNAVRFPDKTAVIVDGRRYCYGELERTASALAVDFASRGIERGDRVAIFAENGWPAVVSIYGTLRAGAAFVLINPQTKADKLRFILADSGASALIAERRLLEPALAHPLPPTLKCAYISGEAGDLPSTPGIDRVRLEEVSADAGNRHLPDRAIPTDLAALIYTSGSTGSPKGVMQTHQSMVFAAGSIGEYLGLRTGDRVFNALPLAFDYGLYQLLMAVQHGATLVLERSFSFMGLVMNRMREEEVTIFPGVPTAFSLLFNANKERLAFPHVRSVTNTAAALPPTFIPRLREVFPNADIFAMYGLTECKRVSYLPPALIDKHPTSVGIAIPGTEVFLLSPEGHPVAPGEPGILHVRGPHLMLGYWGQPEQSAHLLKPGRWPGERSLCTHDWFRQDESGLLYFVGRSDDIIKTGGEKVSPAEVEAILYSIPEVREAAVVGVADELLGQSVCAYVVLDQGADLTELQIREFCRTKLERHMVPHRVHLVASLPKTATGKIRKRGLADSALGGDDRDTASSPSSAVRTAAALDIDADKELARITASLREALRSRLKRRGLVVAISGGVDSAVCAALAARAVGAERVLGLLLPERESSSESLTRGKEVAESLGIGYIIQDITPVLEAVGCYSWRDEAIRTLIPDYDAGWRHKLAISGSQLGQVNHFRLIAESPYGRRVERRLDLRQYLDILAATNYKQRTRKIIEYFHADRLHYAVVGTPNRLEYDQGFFVKNGDGSADVKPIAHLYKTQVYSLARHLGLPESVCSASPTTDTYSLPQGQDEFYFALPYRQMDIALWAYHQRLDPSWLAKALDLSTEVAGAIFADIEHKRRTTRYLHTRPLLVDPSVDLDAKH